MQILEETLMELNVNRKEKISDYSQEEYENICTTLQTKNYENGYGVVINKNYIGNFIINMDLKIILLNNSKNIAKSQELK